MELYHIGYTVRDLEDSYWFYTEICGLRSVSAESKDAEVLALQSTANGMDYFDVKSDELDTLTHNSSAHLRYLYLGDPRDRWILQLVEYVAAGSDAVEHRHNRAGSMHMCFFVDDAPAKREELLAKGNVKISSEIVQMTGNMRSFYAADPDGLPVEFLEQLS